MAVDGVGKSGAGSPEAAKAAKGKTGAFKTVQEKSGGADKPAAAGTKSGAQAAAAAPRPASAGFQISNPEPIKTMEGPAPFIRQEVRDFAQGMVQAADAAAMPGPTTDGDLLPRESVSGLFVRDFVLQGAVAMGRPPLGEDEAARIVIEKHIAGTPGLYYDAAVEVQGADAYLVKLHRLDTNPPFLPDPKAEAVYKIDRRTWQIDEVG